MAKLNRTEVASAVSTKIVPVVTTTIHRDVLNNDLGASVVLKKDVKGTQDGTGLSSLIVDFASNDTVSVTNVTQNFSISVTNLADGERNFIEVNKQAGNTITFTGGILNQTPSQNYIDASLTKVVYEIVYKNGVVYANALTQNLLEASETELRNGTASKFITPEKLQVNTWYDVGNDGGNTAYINGWAAFSEGLSYKVDIFGNLIVQGRANGTSATSNFIFDFLDPSLIPSTDFGTSDIPMGLGTSIVNSVAVGLASVSIEVSSSQFKTSTTGWGNSGDRFETRGCIIYKKP
jgi:hypothetical protein